MGGPIVMIMLVAVVIAAGESKNFIHSGKKTCGCKSSMYAHCQLKKGVCKFGSFAAGRMEGWFEMMVREC